MSLARLLGKEGRRALTTHRPPIQEWQRGSSPKRWDGSRTVTVFGATGFLGRYVVSLLCRSGVTVVTPFRGSQLDARHLKVCGDVGQVLLHPFHIGDAASLDAATAGSQCVVNLIGRDWATKRFSVEDANLATAAAVAESARRSAVPRFVQVSAQGAAEDAPSDLLRSKAAAESAVRDILGDHAVVVRPTPVFGHEDTVSNGYAQLAFKTRYARLPLFHDPECLWQPVYAPDVAEAIARIALAEGGAAAEDGVDYELGGPEVMRFREFVEAIYAVLHEEPRFVHVPGPAAVALAGVAERFMHRPPFTSEAARAGGIDRVADTENALGFANLGLAPTRFSAVALRWLRRHRHHTKQGLL